MRAARIMTGQIEAVAESAHAGVQIDHQRAIDAAERIGESRCSIRFDATGARPAKYSPRGN